MQFEKLQAQLHQRYGSRTLYEALGVKPDSTAEELRRKFREKAFKYHPDRNKAPDAEQRFKDVSAAYEILSNPDRRRQYDAWNQMQRSAGSHEPPQQPRHDYASSQSTQQRQPFSDADLEARVEAFANGEISASELIRGLRPDQYATAEKLIDKYLAKHQAALEEKAQQDTLNIIEQLERKRDEAISQILSSYGTKR